MQFQYILGKKVKEVEKNTLIKVCEDKSLEKCIIWENKRSFGFIFYLSTKFLLVMKNPILGIFSQKFACMYSFYV